jgi:hypothetical protein
MAGRLYDHLRDTTHEGDRPSLEDLAPLYQAIAHGCRAGRHQEALYEVYANRICRPWPNGQLEYYSIKKLGAFGSDLAAITWFFEKPYEKPVPALTEADRSWVLSVAAFCLRAQGRFAEALPADRAGLQMAEHRRTGATPRSAPPISARPSWWSARSNLPLPPPSARSRMPTATAKRLT